LDFYFLPVIYKKRKKRCMLIWKSILTWMHSIRNMQRFSVHFFASILIAVFPGVTSWWSFFFTIFRSNIRGAFFSKINDTKEKNVWKLSSPRFTFTVKKFLETPLRDHCCDLKGTPRGFQKRTFKKNPYVKIWVFGP
jgi:hypothetical protein